MNEKSSHLIELLLLEENLELKISRFKDVTSILLEITDELFVNKIQVEYHQFELEKKYMRFGFANLSILNLINGNKLLFKNHELNLIDVASINSISRMQIESYIMMFYLFFDEISTKEKDFRYDIYKLHGLQKQALFDIDNQTEESLSKIENIKNEINLLIDKIQNSSFFQNAPNKQQREYLEPKFAKVVKSDDLFVKSGINTINFRKMWSLYSNYAHSEYISDRQYNAFIKDLSAMNSCSLNLTINLILTTKLITYLANTFDVCKTKYDKYSLRDRTLIEVFDKMKRS